MVMGSLKQKTEVAVIGAGPGGYVAALRLADLGKEVVLIDERERPGGTCLLEGCIPSKTLIHAASLIDAARDAEPIGLSFGPPKIDLDRLREFTGSVVSGLSDGVRHLLKRRGVEVMHGRARFTSPTSLALEGGEVSNIDFTDAIIATGSRASALRGAGDAPVWSSAQALTLPEVPERLLVVGGGYIGLELGTVYAALGSQVTVAEFFPYLLGGADRDLVDVVVKRAEKRMASIQVDAKVTSIDYRGDEFEVAIQHRGETRKQRFDRVLVSVGRVPNTDGIGIDRTGVEVNPAGRIVTTAEMRTNVPHIYAIGDVARGPMLAHKASREAKVAAEVIAQHKSSFDNRAIPAVVFTDPEIAWTGLTEREVKEQKLQAKIGRFPMRALGRARTLGRTEGMVKVISDADSGLILGVGLVGPYAGELISEATLAVEMGATLEDLMVTIHPHPTLSEAIMEAAEVAGGTTVNLPKAKRAAG